MEGFRGEGAKQGKGIRGSSGDPGREQEVSEGSIRPEGPEGTPARSTVVGRRERGGPGKKSGGGGDRRPQS